MGRSGAGKTLIARLLLGQLPPPPLRAEGRLRIEDGGGSAGSAAITEMDLGNGAPAAAAAFRRRSGARTVPVLAKLRGRRLGWVPQGGRENLVPGWSARRHLRELIPSDAARQDHAVDLLAALDVAATASNLDAVATELSEGMIRRMLLAFAMAGGAELLLVDEPTTGLDPQARRTFIELLERHVLSAGAGVLVVTHDVALAASLGGEAAMVEDGAVVAWTRALGSAGQPFAAFRDAAADASRDAAPSRREAVL
jgi:peptide/nickel transport system ATP-binding protein